MKRAWPSIPQRIVDGTLFATDSPSFYRENADRFGDVVSFRTPNGFRQFQFNHPETIGEMLTLDATHHLRGVVLRRARVILGDGLLTSEEPLHLRQRRLAAPAFQRQRIAAYGAEIVRLTQRPPLPISPIHRQASAMAEVLQERKPSYDVVRRVVRNLPAGLLMLAHRGNKAYGKGFDLVHRREALKPNVIWQVYHAQLDIKLVCEDGSVAKPWLTIVIDDYSRAVAGYDLGFEPHSSLRTTLALRQGYMA